MPTYEFRCPKGHEFERFYKTMSTAPSDVPCPECGAVASRQLSGGGGFLFKGSGFYLTDYGKNAHRGMAPESRSEGAKTDGATAEGAKAEGAKAEGAKAEGAKTEGGKAEGGKADGGKADGGKTESPGKKSDSPQAKRSESKSQSAKPKPE